MFLPGCDAILDSSIWGHARYVCVSNLCLLYLWVSHTTVGLAQARPNKHFAKHACDFSLILLEPCNFLYLSFVLQNQHGWNMRFLHRKFDFRSAKIRFRFLTTFNTKISSPGINLKLQISIKMCSVSCNSKAFRDVIMIGVMY